MPNVAWYQITFVGCPADAVNEAGSGAATALYSCRLDGTGVRRLTFNLSSDYDPYLLRDGRLVYASWQRRTLERGPRGSGGALGGQPGWYRSWAALSWMGAAASSTWRAKRRAGWWSLSRPTAVQGTARGDLPAYRRVVHCTRTGRSRNQGTACFIRRRPCRTAPCSCPGDRSMVPARMAICRVDPVSGRIEAVFDDPAYHDIQAQCVAPRAEPDGRSSPAIDSDPHGKIYCLNVYTNDFRDKAWLPPGTVKTLRLLEGISRSPISSTGTAAPPGAPALADRRVLGEVPVAPDGSFNVEVPANTPIELQLVDASGLALRSCGWVSTRNHFNQGCVGCHEDPELTPENLMVDALRGPSVVVAPPVEQRRSIDFRRDLMPIVNQKCLPCHAQGGSPPDLTARTKDVADAAFARAVYEVLLEPSAGVPSGEPRGRYVDPGRARTSPFVWHLMGSNTSRPWDGATAERKPKPIPPDAKQPLKPEETRLFVEWIDLGAAWTEVAPR